MGKHVITAKQRHSKDPLFPLIIALSGLPLLAKVSVNYIPHPRNTFAIEVNGSDIYNLVKEEPNYDPSKTDELNVMLNMNDKRNSNGKIEFAIDGSIPWILSDFEDKI